MVSPIDPASITQENIPAVLGAMLVMLDQNAEDHKEIKAILKDHEECLRIFRFSRCNLIPWLGRNRWIVVAFFATISIWFSSLDWLNCWLQWAFFPPRVGP